jgi:hypothetical protein
MDRPPVLRVGVLRFLLKTTGKLTAACDMLQLLKLTICDFPRYTSEFREGIKWMLHSDFQMRPTALEVIERFTKMQICEPLAS